MDQVLIDSALERVRAALEAGQVEDALKVLADLHPADRAETFSDLPKEEQDELLPRLDPEDAAELLEELEEDEAAEAVSNLSSADLADVLDEMEPDAAADLLGDLPKAQAESALAQMEPDAAEDVRPLLAHADDTAGGLMTSDFFALRRQMTAQQTIEFLRQQEPDGAMPYYLYVVDRFDKLIGVVGLRDLIAAKPEALIDGFMRRDVRSVPVGTDQEEVARLMTKYSLLALPVVDAEGKLAGVIRSSDIAYVIEEEATEDLYRLSNVSDGDITPFSPIKQSISRRLPWLYVNLFTAFLAAWVVSLFE
ncbi:MAG: magnesium transporter, partial [Anaerolineales bacterium]|nr:magnesium transporter [Anaerolineales bacterium]